MNSIFDTFKRYCFMFIKTLNDALLETQLMT